MDDTLNVYTTKPWTDHDLGLLWTVSDKWNTFIQLVIGFFFGLAQPYLERIVAHLLGWICYCVELCQRNPDHVGGLEAPNENTALLGRKTRSCCCPSSYCNKHCSRNAIAKISSVLIVIFGIAYTVAGTFVTTFPTDKAALSGSKKCGLWGLKDSALPVAQDEDALIQGQKETRAGQYARDCYGPQSATSLDQCSIFKKPYVPTFKVETEQQCPFVNKTYCMGNGFTAVKFTTDLVDATSIGVNAKKAPQFNRTMMCVPLNIYQGFVEKISSQPGHWGYNLGPVSSDEYTSTYTFRQYGDPFTFDVRSYTMSTYVHVYSKATSQNYWTPIPELNIRPELNQKSKPYSLTLLFINSCRIFYKEVSSDPIFPADRRWPRNPDLWTNNDSRARPLACIDWIEVCPRQGKCLPPYEDGEDHDKNYVFTRYALNKSTTFHAIEFRGATGLDAQDKIKDDTSLPLDKDPPQWIVESWGLFNASLSRVQYDAFDIANGTGWDKAPRYDQKMPTWAQGNVCHIFTFQLPKGYDNIRIWPTIGILAIPLGLWLIGMEVSHEFDEKKKKTGYFGDNKLLGIEWAYWKIALLFGRCRGPQPKPIDPDTPDANTQ